MATLRPNLSVRNPPTNEKMKAAPTVAAVMPASQSAAFSTKYYFEGNINIREECLFILI